MAVKVILREVVEHLGEQGEIVSVAPGYARNYLYPKGFALEATPGNLKMLQHRRKIWAAKVAQEVEAAQELADKISAIELSIEKKAGEAGTLYGSVTKPEIVELLAAKGFEIDRKQVGPDDPIKALGTYPVTVKIHRRVVATLKLKVVGEDGAEAAPPVVAEVPEPAAEVTEVPEPEVEAATDSEGLD